MAKHGTDVTVSKGSVERMPRARSPFGEVDRLFDEFFSRRWPRPFGWDPFGERADLAPNVDIIDRDDEVVVRSELPGYRKEDIEISVSGDQLTLSGKTASEEREQDGTYYRLEISRGAFARTLSLPAAVDDAKAKASMKDGMLELTLPKVDGSKRRTISIS